MLQSLRLVSMRQCASKRVMVHHSPRAATSRLRDVTRSRLLSTESSASNAKPQKVPPSTSSASTTPFVAGPQAPPSDLKEVVELLRAYESRYTYRGWHILRYVGLVTVGAVGLLAYFWNDVLRKLSREGSELAQQTMQDEDLQQEIDRITSQTTNTLLNDPRTVQVTLDFLMRLLQKPETRQQVVTFFQKVLTDPTTVHALAQLLRDPVTLRQLQSSFNTLLNDKTIRASLNDLVFRLLEDPQTQRLLENLVMDLLQRPNVKESTADFFGQVLRYPQVIDAATASSRNVVENLSQDEEVHTNLAKTGTSSLKRMVVPGWLLRHHGAQAKQDVVQESAESINSEKLEDEIASDEAAEYVEDALDGGASTPATQYLPAQ